MSTDKQNSILKAGIKQALERLGWIYESHPTVLLKMTIEDLNKTLKETGK